MSGSSDRPPTKTTNPSTTEHISPRRSPHPRRHGQTPSPRSRGWRRWQGSSTWLRSEGRCSGSQAPPPVAPRRGLPPSHWSGTALPCGGCHRWRAPAVRSGSPDGRDAAAWSPSTVHSGGAGSPTTTHSENVDHALQLVAPKLGQRNLLLDTQPATMAGCVSIRITCITSMPGNFHRPDGGT